MRKFRKDSPPPYYAVVYHWTPAPGTDGGQFEEASDIMVGLAAAEPGFLGIEQGADDDGAPFTVCYWNNAAAIRRWRASAAERIPARLSPEQLIGPTGCLWPWLNDVREAQVRREPAFEVAYDDQKRVA